MMNGYQRVSELYPNHFMRERSENLAGQGHRCLILPRSSSAQRQLAWPAIMLAHHGKVSHEGRSATWDRPFFVSLPRLHFSRKIPLLLSTYRRSPTFHNQLQHSTNTEQICTRLPLSSCLTWSLISNIEYRAWIWLYNSSAAFAISSFCRR